MKYFLKSFWKFKSLAIWLARTIITYNLRISFLTDIWFSQNHKGNYGASFKTKKAHLDGPTFYQNPYCQLVFSEHFGHAWLNLTKIIWSNCSFHEYLTTCKKNFIPQIAFEILNPAIWLAQSIFTYNLRTRFFQGMLFPQNRKGNYGAPCKPRKKQIKGLHVLPTPKNPILGYFWVFFHKMWFF